uniref:Uncharacterized protein n=1 Tax=Anguilla anguilla TaxID=7936 RepID=A0A0E9QBP7_ANGAN
MVYLRNVLMVQTYSCFRNIDKYGQYF